MRSCCQPSSAFFMVHCGSNQPYTSCYSSSLDLSLLHGLMLIWSTHHFMPSTLFSIGNPSILHCWFNNFTLHVIYSPIHWTVLSTVYCPFDQPSVLCGSPFHPVGGWGRSAFTVYCRPVNLHFISLYVKILPIRTHKHLFSLLSLTIKLFCLRVPQTMEGSHVNTFITLYYGAFCNVNTRVQPRDDSVFHTLIGFWSICGKSQAPPRRRLTSYLECLGFWHQNCVKQTSHVFPNRDLCDKTWRLKRGYQFITFPIFLLENAIVKPVNTIIQNILAFTVSDNLVLLLELFLSTSNFLK